MIVNAPYETSLEINLEFEIIIKKIIKRGPPDWQESRGERGGGQYDRGYGGGGPGGRGGDRDGQDRREGPPRGDFVRRESYIPPDVADGY